MKKERRKPEEFVRREEGENAMRGRHQEITKIDEDNKKIRNNCKRLGA